MHAMFFGLKRVHLRVLALTRPLLRTAELTPARFDMLRIIGKHPDGILQRNIQFLLGVSAATVSRMLGSLEQLGHVVRRRYERDRRCTLVKLGFSGARALNHAHFETTDQAVDLRMIRRALTDEPRRGLRSPALLRMIRCGEDLLMHARRAFADPSPVRHPWAPVPVACMESTPFTDGTADYPMSGRPFDLIRAELREVGEPVALDFQHLDRIGPLKAAPSLRGLPLDAWGAVIGTATSQGSPPSAWSGASWAAFATGIPRSTRRSTTRSSIAKGT